MEGDRERRWGGRIVMMEGMEEGESGSKREGVRECVWK